MHDVAAVFAVIADAIIARKDDLASIVETGYSFEEWSTWEAYLACHRQGWTVKPRPSYCTYGVASRDFADLFVKTEDASVLVEFAICHGESSVKWSHKINADTDKLSRIRTPGLQGLQVLICGSVKSQIESNEWWRGLLLPVRQWHIPTVMKRNGPLGTTGNLVIAGWIICPAKGPS